MRCGGDGPEDDAQEDRETQGEPPEGERIGQRLRDDLVHAPPLEFQGGAEVEADDPSHGAEVLPPEGLVVVVLGPDVLLEARRELPLGVERPPGGRPHQEEGERGDHPDGRDHPEEAFQHIEKHLCLFPGFIV